MNTSPLPPDSSSSRSSTSLPFRPFSCLPTEIIQHVVEYTSSSHYDPDTYVERQSTLRSLCLTSRLFFQLAKPRLYAVVRLTGREQVKVFRDTEQDRAKAIETFELVLRGQGFKEEYNDLSPLLAVSFSLRSIRLEGFSDGGIDLASFSRLKNLTALGVSNSHLDATDTFALARVEEMNLDDVSSDMPIEEIVSPSTFPALRVLSLTDVKCHNGELSTLLEQLETQLDLIWMDEDDIPRLEPHVFDKINRKTLFDRFCTNRLPLPSLPSVKSCRLWDSQHSEYSTIEKLEEIVRTSTTPLPSVLYLAGCHSPDPHDPALEDSRQQFRDVCKERNMEVIYEAKPDWNGDFGRPTEFYRRMRGGKEKSA
ncbi:hypothetical protein JCM5353_004037 [Sporobolomyces roseus]